MLTCVKCELRAAAAIQERTGQDRPGRNMHNTYSCSVHKPQEHACAHCNCSYCPLWHVCTFHIELHKHQVHTATQLLLWPVGRAPTIVDTVSQRTTFVHLLRTQH